MTKGLCIIPVKTETQIREISILANEIWHQHFIPIIGEEQVDYMIAKFQSYPALKEQIADGYEYFQLFYNHNFIGYTGIHEENGQLFLSKLYLKEDVRGQHISTQVVTFLKELCTNRCLSLIWLTCNRHNEHTLAAYEHLGFIKTRTQAADIGNGFVMDDYIMELDLS